MTDAIHADPRRGRISAPTVPTGGEDPLRQTAADAADPADVVGLLYREHGAALVRTALALVGDRPTAEDVVQDAFAGLYRALPRLHAPDKALAYLRASVVNGCRSVHRARLRSFSRRTEHATEVWSAESAALAREESRLALQAVARLPRRAREVLALRYLLDLGDAEIAAALGVSKATVSSTASRALSALARQLKEEL
jgi:RNA polymerase sigma factor (sigma-70 family)